jgi:predicted kinase
MIRLSSLLLEITNQPKAIFLAGPAGAGKSYIIRQMSLSDFVVINVDDTYEELLKASNIGMKQKDFDAEKLSQAAKLMAQAQKTTRDKYEKSLENLNNIVIDGTGAASNPIEKKKKELEDLGYKTMMLMIWVSPVTSLERNANRDRSLLPSIVLRTWRDINMNIEKYQNMFGDQFVLVNNNPEDAQTDFDPEEIKRRFFDTSLAKGKPKTPEEAAKSAETAKKLNKDIEYLVQQTPKFIPLTQAVSKIKNFVNA